MKYLGPISDDKDLVNKKYVDDKAGVTGVKGNSESSYRTGNVNITKANIGLGNVENKSSATIRGELTKSNVTTALGYTPPKPQMCPIGKIDMYAGSTAPTGWLLCRGQAVSRTTYADLFAAIGTTYGVGDGSTTFNVPDLRDRVPIGAGSSYSLNDNGGSTTHSHTTGNVTLTLDQIPSHNHGNKSLTGSAQVLSNTNPGHSGILSISGTGNGQMGSGSRHGFFWLYADASHTHDSNGGGQAHNHGDTGSASNMMPYRGVNFIIYTGV